MQDAIDRNVARVPDFRGDGCAVWVNKDKNGKKYLSIKVLGSIKLNAFAYEPKPKAEPKPQL